MRTKQDIINEINTEADKYNELSELQANISRVSFWKIIKDVVSFAILTLEMAFEKHLKSVETLIQNTEPGTDNWYKEKALQYQDGDTIAVINNVTEYPIVDKTKKIIKRVSIIDKINGGIKMKVAKSGTNGLEPLSSDEKIRFSTYIGRIKMVGVPIEVISLPANLLSITATIELDRLIYNSDGTKVSDGSTPVLTAIQQYLESFPFDEKFYLSKLVDTIQLVEGVNDVDINAASLDGLAFIRKIDEVPSGYLSLDVNNSNINYVLI